jgi:modulator of FtsH protease HflK
MSKPHNHTHDHEHDHDHDNERREIAPAAPALPPSEDAGAQALDEALRSSFRVIKGLMILLVVVFLFSGFFTVKPNEVAVVLRFGKIRGDGAEQILKPGIHYAFPYPIDEIKRMSVGQSISLSSTNGWYALSAEDIKTKNFGPTLRPGIDGYNLTGDGNIVHSRATLKYRLTEQTARDYYFGFVNPTNVLSAALENSLIYAAGQMTADHVIISDKAAFRDLATQRLKQLLAQMGLSIVWEPLEIETSASPMVQDVFDEVIIAQQNASKTNHEAEAYARVRTNNAAGQASVIVGAATTRSNYTVVTVQAETERFTKQLPAYLADADLLKQQLMAETMQKVLSQARDKFFVPMRGDGQPRELRLQLNREPLKEKE